SHDPKTDVVGQPRRAIDTNGRPLEPRADRTRRFEPDPSRVDSFDGRVEFGHTASSVAQQFACTPQDPPRVTAEADVAVGPQHRVPPACPPERIENVAAKSRGAARV